MNRQRYLIVCAIAIFVSMILVVAGAAMAGGQKDRHKGWHKGWYKDKAPVFEVDPFWPKPLPNQWQIGQVPGIAVDKDDNIWIVHRPRSFTSDEAGATDALVDTDGDGIPDADVLGNPRPAGPIADCCYPAPSVLQFDKKGNLLRAWGGPNLGFEDPDWNWPANTCLEEQGCFWPNSEHGIYVDHNMNVWLGGQQGRSVVKFAADGTFLLQIGERTPPVADSNDTDGAADGTPLLAQPADLEVDPGPNTPSGGDELYIADGYTNHRVIVVDAETGMYLRHWGAYGQNPVDDDLSDAMGPNTNPAPGTDPEFDAPPHFRNPVHAVRITKDGLVYVADRVNNRIQVFDKKTVGAVCDPFPNPGPGKCGFLGEFFVERDTLGPGSTWDLEVSPDKRQKLLYNADGSNQHIWTLRRADGRILGNFGRNGRFAGQFHWVHNLAADSQGNMYTAEVDTGKRVQKFNCKGSGCK
ncbi:MAG: hypothetical protein JSW26_08590 [Desulfobacterales bacterium]|nr:MAG: hypothetical protein JSW26_08590 [Desulfobacterales bacterium]